MQTISSLVLVLAASMPLVQAAPKMETRQSETGANVDGGDAACPFEAPFRVTTNESSWWSKICIAYNTDPASACAFEGTVEERTLQGTTYELCSEMYP